MSELVTNKDSMQQQIKTVENVAFKMGFNASSFVGGVAVGAVDAAGRGIAMALKFSWKLAVESAKKAKNAFVRNQSNRVEKTIESSTYTIEDAEKLSRREKLGDTQNQRVAKFIDRLAELGMVNNRDRSFVGYKFDKTSSEDGIIKYTVKNAESNQLILSFNRDPKGGIAIDRIEPNFEAEELLMKNIESIAPRINADLEQVDENQIDYTDVPKALAKLDLDVSEVNTSIVRQIAVDSQTTDGKLNEVETLGKDTSKIGSLKLAARRIQSILDSEIRANEMMIERTPLNEIQRSKPSLLALKLSGINRTIGIVEANIGVKQQQIDNFKPLKTDGDEIKMLVDPREIEARAKLQKLEQELAESARKVAEAKAAQLEIEGKREQAKTTLNEIAGNQSGVGLSASLVEQLASELNPESLEFESREFKIPPEYDPSEINYAEESEFEPNL